MEKFRRILTFGLLASASGAWAQSNFTIYYCYLGGFPPMHIFGGATGTGASATKAVFDDITPLPGYEGQQIIHIDRLYGVQGATGTYFVGCKYSFHAADGATVGETGVQGPGTLLRTVSFPTRIFGDGITNGSATDGLGTVPEYPFWFGWQYDNFAHPTVTPAQLNVIGMLYGAARIGSSTDMLWVSDNTDPSYVNAPVGTQQRLSTTLLNNMSVTMAVMGQDFTGTLSLQDVVPLTIARTINYEVTSGTMAISSGSITVNTNRTTRTFRIILPNIPPTGATSSYQIAFDGGSFLKKTLQVAVPGVAAPTAIAVGTVSLVNGDVDNSGEVDAADIDAVISDFGDVWPGGAGNPLSDLDGSGEVDAADIDIATANFGAVDS